MQPDRVLAALTILMRQQTSLASFAMSIPSAIMRHRMENGRRYHAYKEGSTLESIFISPVTVIMLVLTPI